MEIKLVHRRPRRPMRMGNVLRALEKIPTPDLSAYLAEGAEITLEQRPRNEEPECPNERLLDFLLDALRQGRANLNGLANLARELCILFEAVRRPLTIHDVRAEEGSAAVELKIEVAAAGFWLRKEFHATVFPYLVEISRSHAANVLILHLKNAVYSLGVIEQPSGSARTMTATLGAEMVNFQCRGRSPEGVLPIRLERGRRLRSVNNIFRP